MVRFSLPVGYSDADVQRWLYLRAIEWTNLPAFVTQPIIPVLLLFVLWWATILGVVAVTFIWSLARYSLINVRMANYCSLFVIIFKWPVAICSCVYLVIQGRYALAGVALLWPMLAALTSLPISLVLMAVRKPTEIGRIELVLATQIGMSVIHHEVGAKGTECE